jgi:nicotinate-nucleotide adenylyltransferase
LGLKTAGIVGGTFDPIHVGHLALARSAQAALGLQRLIFVPTGNPWQKQDRVITPAQHRVAMLSLALRTLPTAAIDTFEIDQAQLHGSPSFSINTVQALRQRHADIERWVLIIGSDQLHRLHTWRQWQELVQYCHVAVTTRENIGLTDLPPEVDAFVNQYGRQALPATSAGNLVFFSMPPVAVSSTGLRRALAMNQSVDALLDPAVLRYLQQHRLYQADSNKLGQN